jgi:peroxiredoxin
LGQELIVQSILAQQPDHPGAHHYRIHNWDDGKLAEQALESCLRFGRIAPNSGHACHMPGHVYSQMGMYHEAAIWMDTAARVERKYMHERLAFAQDTWNYPHDVHYLGYLLEQLGMADAAIANARNMLEIPVDPENDDDRSQGGGIRERGQLGLIRALIKFERWDEIRREGSISWADTPADNLRKAYGLGLAELAAGDVLAAKKQLAALRKVEDTLEDKSAQQDEFEIMWRELTALSRIREGEHLPGLQLLLEAAEREFVLRKYYDDPPDFPRMLYTVLGEVYLDLQSPRLAVDAFKKTLELVPNDGMALSGLVRAYTALGDALHADDALARFEHVWSDADKDLRWTKLARASGAKSALAPESPPLRAERNFAAHASAADGPEKWQAFAAPQLDALDAKGSPLSLERFAGHNVLLVFYLGEECPHCMEQLQALQKRGDDFAAADVRVLAISSASPEKNAASTALGELHMTLLSDDAAHSNARRFHAFDDFEELELHATILIDRQGRIRWARFGGDPYMDFDLLLSMAEGPKPAKY